MLQLIKKNIPTKKNIKLLILFSAFFFFVISFYLITKHNNEFKLTFDIKILNNKYEKFKGQVYYKYFDIYNEKNSLILKYQPTEKFQKQEYVIKNVYNIHSLRIDPLNNQGTVEIKNFKIHHDTQIYPINFKKVVSLKTLHDINILDQSSHKLVLQTLGNDPYLEIINNLNINIINMKNILYALFATFLLFIIFPLFLRFRESPIVKHLILFIILFIYSWYAILFSSWDAGKDLLILLFLLSLFVALQNSFNITLLYIKNILLFVTLYFVMGYISTYITTYADIKYLNEKAPYILWALLLPIGFYKIKDFKFYFFKYLLTLLLIFMAVFIIMLNNNIISIDQIELFNFTMKRTPWTQKNYMFWYVLLTFGTITFYNIRKKNDFVGILMIILMSYFAIIGGYSDSAKLSFFIGVLIYICFSAFKISKKNLKIFIWIFTFYIIFAPIILSYLPWETFKNLISGRGDIYITAVKLIQEHWLIGYGYGSTLHVNLSDMIDISNIPYQLYNNGRFPGGHPHNLSLLFWLEFGIFGATFLAYFIHKLLLYIVEHTYNYINQAAIFSILTSFEIITSFSWSIWYPQVLLTFAFFGIMLTLSMNIKIKKTGS